LLREINDIPGDKRTLNKRIVEALANELYTMELNSEPSRRVWAYRKAAWAIEDLEQEVELMKSKRDGQSASRFT
jgi:DNA polymerase/3'-5' exonuclease PolX